MAFQLARKISTSVIHHSVQVPIQLFGIEGRYATALYSAAVKLNQLEAVEKDLNKLKKVLKTDKKFLEFLNDPVLNRALKSSAVQKALLKLEFSDPTKRFFDIMGKNGQLHRTVSIISQMESIFEASKGNVKCIITTAKPIDEATEKEFIAALQLFVSKDQKIIVEKKIDKELIGGATVSIGDRFVDMSVAKKVRMFHAVLERAIS